MITIVPPPISRGRFARVVLLGTALSVAGVVTDPLRAAEAPSDFGLLSLQQLAQIKVVSVSRHATALNSTAAAISVLTDDDLRLAGITSIPEALRLAPGMGVARVGAASWAISPRGFMSPLADKMLVLMDGRSVYDPFFSGVYWDTQDYVLEDLSRIEVIRGPGGTIWGSNAVNGVVNIISKSAAETQGLLVTGGFSSRDPLAAAVRYGGPLGRTGHFRVYGKFDRHGSLNLVGGGEAEDYWTAARGGFRADWNATVQDLVTVQGDLYHNTYETTTFLPTVVRPFERPLVGDTQASGGNALARWTRTFSPESAWTLQSYFERTHRDALTFDIRTEVVDVDFNHRLPVGDRHNVTWGLGLRTMRDRFRDQIPEFKITPASDARQLITALLQDEIALAPDQLTLTVGSKFEHNVFSGGEILPSCRLLWQPDETRVLWAAVTRAVRSPSRSDNSLQVDFQSAPPGALGFNSLPVLFQGTGSSRRAQGTLGYELGGRLQPIPVVSLDLSVFYNDYDNVFSLMSGAPRPVAGAVPYLAIPVTSGNDATATTHGAELAVNWQPAKSWRIRANYSLTRLRMRLPPGSQSGGDAYIPNQASLSGSWTSGASWQISGALRYVDVVRNGSIPAYLTADLRVAWRLNRATEVALVGQNLLDNSHPEFGRALIERGPLTEVPRSLSARINWKF